MNDLNQDQIYHEMLRQHLEQPHEDLRGPALRLHASLHTVVETQILEKDPPATSETIDRLTRGGLSRHDAVHLICDVVARQFAKVVDGRADYDEANYVAALSALSPKSERHP